MMTQTLHRIFQRLIRPGQLTQVSRSIEIFGWIDLLLGLLILIAPHFTAAVFDLPPLSALDISPLRVVGVLVTMPRRALHHQRPIQWPRLRCRDPVG
jgi:hypothetical protein